MKKFYSFLFAAVALVGFAACNSDSTEEPAPAQENVGKMEFTANVGEDTKTSLDGMSVKWCETDKISINGVEYSIKEGSISADGKSATFVGEPVEAPYFAVYGKSAAPYEFDDKKYVTVELVANVAEGTFADGANIAVAYSEEEAVLSFKNMLSVLKFQVAAACESVTFTASDKIVGSFNISQDGEFAAYKLGEESFTLTGNFEPGKDYYTTVVPGTYALTIRTNGYLSTTKDSKKIVKNKIYNLGTLPVATVFYVEGNADFKLYAWSGDNKFLGNWPGTAMTKIGSTNKYYAVIPDEYVGTTFNYIVNWTGGQTKDLIVNEFASGYTYSISDPDPENITIYLNNNWSVQNLKIHSWDPTLWSGQTWEKQKAPDGTVTNDLGTFSYWNIDKNQIKEDKVGSLLVTGTDKKTADLHNVNYENDVYLQFAWNEKDGDHLEILTTPY